jgi:large subunit ribosomal protein L6
MSRIGKLPVEIPKGVKVSISDSLLSVEGPKGKLSQVLKPEVSIQVEGDIARVSRSNDSKQARAYHGLFRKLLFNMVTGVSAGFSKTLVVNGVGYKAEVKGKNLILNVGFSNPVEYYISEGLSITCDGPNKIVVSGINREKVGQACAEIRSIRPPEPYKGKGIKYENEYVRRKVGKAGVK